ncbi:hypothetical protein [Dyadobacter frigoris]|uniref:hypothetical protein n=1 Tax=Dyadobacter frigoris TaxID=2576211 RepID=UPI002554FF11|nr:hypothetical protein [Dyadobacter frigoris]
MDIIKTATITSFRVYTAEDVGLTASLQLMIEGLACEFGGHNLFISLPEDYTYVGHFIFKCLETVGVTETKELIGKEIKCRIVDDRVVGIGDMEFSRWFYPITDFELIESDKFQEDGIPD